MLKPKVDINCDIGESYGAYKIGNDEKIMPHITSASMACGFHAGDPMTIAQTIHLARKFGVAMGAHPGFPDLMGFGRREMQLSSQEVRNYIIYQIGAVLGFTKASDVKLQHVKPHGALYNMAAKDGKLGSAIVEAVKVLDANLIVFAQQESMLARSATRAELRVAHEFFGDRAYDSDGCLISRKNPEAIINEPAKVVERTTKAVVDGTVSTVDGELLNIGEVHTICIHGDTPGAVQLAEALRKGLTRAGIGVEPVGKFL